MFDPRWIVWALGIWAAFMLKRELPKFWRETLDDLRGEE